MWCLPPPYGVALGLDATLKEIGDNRAILYDTDSGSLVEPISYAMVFYFNWDGLKLMKAHRITAFFSVDIYSLLFYLGA